MPVSGGEPSELLPNASALTWVDPHQVMFSEGGRATKIVTAAENRANQRDVYVPGGNNMAHPSYLSPDSKWVLVVEMAEHVSWMPCRLVPFAGDQNRGWSARFHRHAPRRPGRLTGAGCTSLQMLVAGLTFGGSDFPTALSSNLPLEQRKNAGSQWRGTGKSLVTAVGSMQSTVSVHTRKGDQQVSTEGSAYLPSLSSDGHALYYLVRKQFGEALSRLVAIGAEFRSQRAVSSRDASCSLQCLLRWEASGVYPACR